MISMKCIYRCVLVCLGFFLQISNRFSATAEDFSAGSNILLLDINLADHFVLSSCRAICDIDKISSLCNQVKITKMFFNTFFFLQNYIKKVINIYVVIIYLVCSP